MRADREAINRNQRRITHKANIYKQIVSRMVEERVTQPVKCTRKI